MAFDIRLKFEIECDCCEVEREEMECLLGSPLADNFGPLDYAELFEAVRNAILDQLCILSFKGWKHYAGVGDWKFTCPKCARGNDERTT